jgi:pimeloyl-ACP methyl ester carboxylesterase
MKSQAAAATRPITARDLLGPAAAAAVGDPEGAAVRRLGAGARSLGDYLDDVASTARLNAKALQEKADGLGRRQAEVAEKARDTLAGLAPEDFASYLADVWQRWAIFMEILRRRGNTFVEHTAQGCPPVLVYDYDVVIDGMTLDRPVNYSLVAIHPPKGVKVREDGRPYIIIDPRAGHGSGIGGFKSESEVGVALHAGHPVYFCIFSTLPTPTQTLADVTRAEADFVREVRRRHPRSPKPVVIGNCQGGWAAMVLAASNPDLAGPVVVNGAPLSYWAGTRGRNPMRYVGGIVGGVAPALLMADLGNGRFDGANLVLNFENLNPGNSLWEKYYDVFADVEGQAQRYLDFERWWSGFYFMNEQEIRWIVENLFVGNRLAHGGAQLDPRLHIDLRNIRAPIIVFASHGDNITPPQQALNWITDLYASVQEIKARGQRIVYTIHDKVGHLGIFVSSSIAKKEHREIVSTLKTIEALAPGLYEMKIEDVQGEGLETRYAISFHERSIEDILALDDDRGDERPFAAVSRLSRLSAEAYELTLRPFVRALANEATARVLADTQPLRLQRTLLSDRNPFLAWVPSMAKLAQDYRVPGGKENPLYALERANAALFTQWLDLGRDMRDAATEMLFFATWSTPGMRELASAEPSRISEVAGTDLRSLNEVSRAIERIEQGGYPEAVIRMLVLLAHARKSVRRDRLERSNEVLTTHEPFLSLGAATRAQIIHEQGLIVEFEPAMAIATLPLLLKSAADRRRALHQCEFILGDPSEMNEDTREMLERIRMALDAGEARRPARSSPRRRAKAARAKSARRRA